MLSSKAKYALRAVLRLAEDASDTWLQTSDIAEQEQVPRKFLEAILVQLRDNGIIESRRGAHGGHRFLRDPVAGVLETCSLAQLATSRRPNKRLPSKRKLLPPKMSRRSEPPPHAIGKAPPKKAATAAPTD